MSHEIAARRTTRSELSEIVLSYHCDFRRSSSLKGFVSASHLGNQRSEEAQAVVLRHRVPTTIYPRFQAVRSRHSLRRCQSLHLNTYSSDSDKPSQLSCHSLWELYKPDIIVWTGVVGPFASLANEDQCSQSSNDWPNRSPSLDCRRKGGVLDEVQHWHSTASGHLVRVSVACLAAKVSCFSHSRCRLYDLTRYVCTAPR